MKPFPLRGTVNHERRQPEIAKLQPASSQSQRMPEKRNEA